MQELTKNQTITLASPLPFVLVSALDEAGKPNAIGVSWVTFTSWDPWLVSISVGPARYSHGCIEQGGEFVVNYPGAALAQAAWKCSSKSGRDHDKFAEFGLEALPALKVEPPRIVGSTVCIECKVVDRFTTGDHTVFVGEVVAASGVPEPSQHLFCVHYTKLVSADSEGATDFDLAFK
jgi:flavin reductase (DIM6/NTAB) family NADH-FMN oxidoreductase RutF